MQVCHEWNTAVHVQDAESDPRKRAFTRDELQALFDYADDQVGVIRAAGRKGWLAAFRDATLFKVAYGYGLRRTETAMLDTADFGANPHAPEFGDRGVCYVRYGKAMKGSPPRRRSVLTVWPWVAEVLAEWVTVIRPLCGPDGNPALWPTERAPRISVHQIDHRFAACRAALGFPAGLDFHSLRRSYVTHLIEDGVDPLFVQFFLSPRKGVHDVQHEPFTGADLRGGGGYLPPSITRIPWRFDACSAGPDARLVA